MHVMSACVVFAKRAGSPPRPPALAASASSFRALAAAETAFFVALVEAAEEMAVSGNRRAGPTAEVDGKTIEGALAMELGAETEPPLPSKWDGSQAARPSSFVVGGVNDDFHGGGDGSASNPPFRLACCCRCQPEVPTPTRFALNDE